MLSRVIAPDKLPWSLPNFIIGISLSLSLLLLCFWLLMVGDLLSRPPGGKPFGALLIFGGILSIPAVFGGLAASAVLVVFRRILERRGTRIVPERELLLTTNGTALILFLIHETFRRRILRFVLPTLIAQTLFFSLSYLYELIRSHGRFFLLTLQLPVITTTALSAAILIAHLPSRKKSQRFITAALALAHSLAIAVLLSGTWTELTLTDGQNTTLNFLRIQLFLQSILLLTMIIQARIPVWTGFWKAMGAPLAAGFAFLGAYHFLPVLYWISPESARMLLGPWGVFSWILIHGWLCTVALSILPYHFYDPEPFNLAARKRYRDRVTA